MKSKTFIVDNDKCSSLKIEHLINNKMPELELIGSLNTTQINANLIEQQQAKMLILNLNLIDSKLISKLREIENPNFTILFVAPDTM